MAAINSCTFDQKDIETIVFEYYEKCENKNPCIINFADAMPFKWDKMYVLPESVTNEGVNKIIGMKYSKNKDIARLILFIKDNEIVFEELDLKYDDDYKINFRRTDVGRYSNKTAKFNINQKNGKLYLNHTL